MLFWGEILYHIYSIYFMTLHDKIVYITNFHGDSLISTRPHWTPLDHTEPYWTTCIRPHLIKRAPLKTTYVTFMWNSFMRKLLLMPQHVYCFRVHWMHEMQTIVTDDCSVCQSVCHTVQLLGPGTCSGVVRCSHGQVTLAFFAMINVHEYLNVLFNRVDITHISCIVDMMKTLNSLNHQLSSVLLWCPCCSECRPVNL